MKTGAGFLHLNTPKDIQYTAGCVLSARDIEASKPTTRVGIVKLPSYMHHVRKGLGYATGLLSLKPLLEDQEDAFELPPVKPLPTATPLATSSGSVGAIDIVVHHLESGKQTFKLQDFDGVMEGGEVPMIVKDEEDAEREHALEAFTIYPWTMTEEERAAYQRLTALWRTKSNGGPAGHSTTSSSGEPTAKRHRVDGSGGQFTARGVSVAPAAPSGQAVEFYDDIEFAIRLAEDALR